MTGTVTNEPDLPVVTPVDVYLNAQADLSAVERFARADVSGRTEQWSELIPLSAPKPGQQFRFDVDLDSCTGCKACVTACHSLNGLDEGESFRSVGVLHDVAQGDRSPSVAAQQTVTTACHHCVEPACLIGCPAEAYEKDPVSGIVRHLDDACIGCEYCTMMCPYDVPVYNDRLGIVRKCDMCSDRLADGEAPACVQGCPNLAISISVVDTAVVDSAVVEPVIAEPVIADPVGVDSPVSELYAVADDSDRLVPGAPTSAITNPTTLYRRKEQLSASTQPGDLGVVRPSPAHLPLVCFLVLSQLAVGLHTALTVLGRWVPPSAETFGAIVVALLTTVAVASSTLHLGQPLKAWRSVLGYRHSWLSREAIVLGAFALCVLLLAGARTVGVATALFNNAVVLWLVAAIGLVAVYCSVMVYVVTRRSWWRISLTGTKFGFTTILGGSAGAFTLLTLWPVVDVGASSSQGVRIGLVFATLASALGVVLSELAVFSGDDDERRRTSLLLSSEFAAQLRLRVATLVVGGVVCPASALVLESSLFAACWAVLGLFLVVVSELVGRWLFFRASSISHMPGSVQ